MTLTDCEINVTLIWCEDCIIFSTTRKTEFIVTDEKTLHSQCNFVNSRKCKTITTIKFGF